LGVLKADRGNPGITLRDLLQKLSAVYCGKVGIEFMHITDRKLLEWIVEKIEQSRPINPSVQDKLALHKQLAEVSFLEKFIADKFANYHRYALNGVEAVIPGLKAVIERSVELGVNNFVIGTPSRGRFSVLSNVLQLELDELFQDFLDESVSDLHLTDVKHH
jgi:2-oxoglutarate dehydrogenase E1 component